MYHRYIQYISPIHMYHHIRTMLLEDELLPEKEQVLLSSEFTVSVGDYIALTVLRYSGLHL